MLALAVAAILPLAAILQLSEYASLAINSYCSNIAAIFRFGLNIFIHISIYSNIQIYILQYYHDGIQKKVLRLIRICFPLNITLLWVGLHCEIVVFPDHTACTDPGNIVGGARGGGAGPSATSFFFSHQLNLRFF